MPHVIRHTKQSAQTVEWEAPERISLRELTRGLPQIPLPWFEMVLFVGFVAMIYVGT